jgi:hypothetical protein
VNLKSFPSGTSPITPSYRFYSEEPSIQLKDISYSITPLIHEKTINIKQERFGSLLEKHKLVYEKPIVNIFETIRSVRNTLGNRRSRRLIPRQITFAKKKMKKLRKKKE